MTEIIDFTTRERLFTADDPALDEAAFEHALCMGRVEGLRDQLRSLQEREAPNVLPIDNKKRLLEGMALTAQLNSRLAELAFHEQRVTQLRKRYPQSALDDMSSVLPEL